MVTFMIAAHAQPELFKRLVSKLQVPGANVVAHIDKKVSEKEFKSGLADKVHFLENRRKINWGGEVKAR